MKLYYLIYISKAAKPMQDSDLEEILNESRSWNSDHGLTGMLLYIRGQLGNQPEGRFMQTLEGSEEEVRYIFGKIRKDPRHHNIMLMNEGNITKRNFQTWLMGFDALDMEKYESTPGYFNLNDDFLLSKRGKEFNIPLNFLKSFYMMGLGKAG